MARQKFLDGGFIGKLGAVVGQRRGSTIYVRTYVKTPNPDSPAQHAHRQGFAKAVLLSQQAYNINKGAAMWQREGKSEWSWRVSTCYGRLKAGMSDEQALPLYPDGYTPNQTVVGVAANFVATDDQVHITSTSPIMSTDRVFTIQIRCYDRITSQWREFQDTKTIVSGSTFSYDSWWEGDTSYPTGAYITAATSDDASHSGASIELPQTPLTEPRPATVSETIVATSIIPNSGTHSIDFVFSKTPDMWTGIIETTLHYYDTEEGGWEDMELEIEVTKGVPLNYSIPWEDNFSYPNGSYIHDEQIAPISPNYIQIDLDKTDFNT